MMPFKDKLKKIRIAFRLTQKEMGDKIGISRNTIGNWEKGNGKPDIEDIGRIVKELDINPFWLLCDEGEMLLDKDRVTGNQEEILDKFLDAYVPGFPPDERLTLKSIIEEATDPVMVHELKTQVLLIKAGPFKEYFQRKETEKTNKVITMSGV